ncbi:MAG: class I tRNA ligase family protein [Isosphaeraceae bacterium]
MPIENKVMKDLGGKVAGLSPARGPRKVPGRGTAGSKSSGTSSAASDPRRLGQSLPDPGPVLNRASSDVLADLLEAGHVFRQLKPIHWCIQDRTRPAEADSSTRKDQPQHLRQFPDGGRPGPNPGDRAPGTPWSGRRPPGPSRPTWPSRRTRTSHAGIRYTDPVSGRPVHAILAADLVAKVMALKGVDDATELGRCTGRELEHAEYRHPFLDRVSPIVLASYVSVDDGTGLVHTAPGHGAEDYQTGRAYQLSTLSPVDAGGRFQEEAPEWLRGQQVFQANPAIVERLKQDGHLFHEMPLVHSYPHCWRCHKPVIFRATEQWFIAIDHADLRGRTLKQIEAVRWLPAWGRTRIESMVSLRPDWCVSRQRYWGVPIPALYNEQTGEAHLTAASARYFRDLFRNEGADTWYTRPVEELIPPDLDRERFPVEHLKKGTDILDVWFESGSSHRAVLARNFELGYPAFLYLEGSDQHRGWFQSSILTAVGTTGIAPFESVLTHGFIVDDKGRKMSKSLGNVIQAVKATEAYGADVLRLYVASLDYADDIRMSEKGIKEASEAYRKIRNTFRYFLGNLEDYAHFDPSTFDASSLHEIDRWALGQLNAVIRDVTDSFEKFEFYRAFQRIYQFCSIDLSSFYLDVLKDRLYSERPNGRDRQAAQYVMARLHDVLARLLAPILPHTTEELWDFLPERPGKAASVHVADWPEIDPRWDDQELAERFARLLAIRELAFAEAVEPARKAKLIGSNQEALVEIVADPPMAAFLLENRDLLATLMIVSEVRVGGGAEGAPTQVSARKSPHPKCERCWNLRESVGADPEHPSLCGRCAQVIRATA